MTLERFARGWRRVVLETGSLRRPFSDLAASEPEHEDESALGEGQEKLDQLISRINNLAVGEEEPIDSDDPTRALATDDNRFVPLEPDSFDAAGVTDGEVEALALKYLLARGNASGRDIAQQIKLPFVLVDELMRQLKVDQLVVHRGAAPERTRDAHVRPLEQRRLPRLVERQQPAHLPQQSLVRERIGRQLVAQEAADHLLRVDDRVQCHVPFSPSDKRIPLVRAQSSRRQHASHCGLRGAQTARPCATRFTCSRRATPLGIQPSSSR